MANFGKLIAIMAVAALPVAFAPDALAQNSHNPNMGHFYMARQQWQVTNDSPVIKMQGGGAAPQNVRAPQGGPPPLPRAGFTRFSQSMPQYRTALPNVHNGVPKPMPKARKTTRRKGNKGKTGKWKAPKKKVVKRKGPIKMKNYSPYKGYDPKVVAKPGHSRATASHSGARTKTKTKVKGSVLHWARGQR